MKDDILFVTFRMTPPFFLGGAEVSQRILAERLNAAGYKVYCIGSYAHPVRNTWDSLPAYCNQLKKLNIPFEFIGPGSDLSYSYKGVFCTMVPQEKIIDKLKQKLEEGVRKMIEWARKHGPADFKYLEDLEIVNEHTPSTWKDKLL